MKRIVTFGEIMLRLKAPGRERLFQTGLLESSFGGGEANVAVSLARLGHEAAFVGVVSDDAVGEAALTALRAQGVDSVGVQRKPGRTGIYFLEAGADSRASRVVYDRSGSLAAAMKPGDFDWPSLLAGAAWFHISGITPALSASAAEASIEATRAARAAGATVSLDLNYRKKLWNYGKAASEVMGALAELADVLIANEEDIQLGLGLRSAGASHVSGIDEEAYRTLAATVVARYPNVKRVAITLRESRSADRNGWSGCLLGEDGFRRSRRHELDDIVDRVGSGDAFAAGFICALLDGKGEAAALEFAVAASALKHTIPGDWNLVSRAEVEALAAGEASGRVVR